MTEFKLSKLVFEKDKGFYKTPHLLLKKDVKEFIRLLKEEIISTYPLTKMLLNNLKYDINELAGDELIWV